MTEHDVNSMSHWPRIVAESLRDVAAPRATSFPAPRHAPADEVARVAHDALAPRRAAVAPPSWLLEHQHDSWQRVMAALDAYGAAMLAEGVGHGKTWIALAVAAHTHEPTVVVVPAILRGQWADTARRASVTVEIVTHEQMSRGTLPRTRATLVIIDEAHRFRTRGTRRARIIAPWLIGRRTLLLTATPIVNRIDDLVAELQLVLPDDTLALDGLASIAELDPARGPPAALRRIIVRSVLPALAVPRRIVPWRPSPEERRRVDGALRAIGTLTLSHAASIRRLIRTTLLDAAASSDAALRDALGRYQALLRHARDAGGASRAVLRRFAGPALGQFTLWELLDVGASDGELALDDLPHLDTILARHRPGDDAWLTGLRRNVDDGIITVCFTRHRATAELVRRALGDNVAWVTGDAAGVGPHRVARDQVLPAFGPQRLQWTVRRTTPVILVATDVAAEGLDLQAAGRIVHIDLPWTATRRDQREGRLLRLGQAHGEVEVVTREPSPAIERLLAPHARIARKAALAERWLTAIETVTTSTSTVTRGTPIAIVGTRSAELAVVVLALTRGRASGVRVLTRRDGEWVDGMLHDDACWARAAASPPAVMPRGMLDVLLLDAMSHAHRTTTSSTHAPCGDLVPRLQALAQRAMRRRDLAALRDLDRIVRFVVASPTTGARQLIARLAEAPDHELLRTVVPEPRDHAPLSVRVLAALVFRSVGGPLR